MKLFSKYRTSFIFIVLFFFHQAPAAHMILNAPVVTQTLQYCATGLSFLFAYFKHQNQTSSSCTIKTDNHNNKPVVPNVVINNKNRTNVRYYVNSTDIPPGYVAQYVPIDNQGNFRYMIEEPSPNDSVRCHCGCCTTFDCGCKCGCGCDKPKKKERKTNKIHKSEFFKKTEIKNNYFQVQPGIYKLKKNGTPIVKHANLLQWDHLHGEVEVYKNENTHLGALDPETLQIYKSSVNARKL